jgi:hypothetical protein
MSGGDVKEKPRRAPDLWGFDPATGIVEGLSADQVEASVRPGVKYFATEREALEAARLRATEELLRRARKASAIAKNKSERIARVQADPETWRRPYLLEAERRNQLDRALAELRSVGV